MKRWLRIISVFSAAATMLVSGCSLSAVTVITTPSAPSAHLDSRPPSSFIDARDQIDPVQSSQGVSAAAAASVAQPIHSGQPQSQWVVQQPVYVIAPTCSPRYDWAYYAVKRGDTLARIASWYGTTAATLAYANCISNPNVIYVGQHLRVPYSHAPRPRPPHPDPPTYPPHYPPTHPPATHLPPTPIPPVIIGSALTISSFAAVNNNVYTLNPDELITISWNSAFPTATRQVAFELIAPTGGSQVIGIDSNLGDGASILWRTVPGTQGTLRAVASFNGGFPPQASDAYYLIVP